MKTAVPKVSNCGLKPGLAAWSSTSPADTNCARQYWCLGRTG